MRGGAAFRRANAVHIRNVRRRATIARHCTVRAAPLRHHRARRAGNISAWNMCVHSTPAGIISKDWKGRICGRHKAPIPIGSGKRAPLPTMPLPMAPTGPKMRLAYCGGKPARARQGPGGCFHHRTGRRFHALGSMTTPVSLTSSPGIVNWPGAIIRTPIRDVGIMNPACRL